MKSLTIEELSIGDSASFSKTVTESDVESFAVISGDFNPIHVDEAFAARSRFKTRVAHGPITLALVAGVLGTELPGVGTIAVRNEIDYLRPVFLGDTITSAVRVSAIDRESRRVQLDLNWTNQDGKAVAEGLAIVIPPEASAL